jgi:hypothetical protein
MVELAALYGDLKKQNIYLFSYNVGPEKSVTLEMNHKYAIFADFFQMDSIAEIKRALAHEIGHCATGCTHKVCSSLDLVQKHEYKANRWAIERYLPFDNLNTAIVNGYSEPWQLAEYFDFPEDFINKAIDYYEISKERKFG